MDRSIKIIDDTIGHRPAAAALHSLCRFEPGSTLRHSATQHLATGSKGS
jgi:hypothetical protein